MAIVIVARPIQQSFSHKTESGIFNIGNQKTVDVNITVPGGTLMSFSFHETSRRNADINFVSNEGGLHWTGKTKTNSEGESGNFEGHVRAMFAKVEEVFDPGQQAVFNSFVNKDLGVSVNVSQFYAAQLQISKNLIALNDALGGNAAVAVRDVDSALQAWHAEVSLPGGKYLVVPSPDSRWAISGGSGGAHDNDFHGGGEFDGQTILIPLNPMRLGGLAGALFVDSIAADVFQFSPGKNEHILGVPSQGGKLRFIIGDLNNTYGDNHGLCKVAVFKTE
jgi:hypothetical protein